MSLTECYITVSCRLFIIHHLIIMKLRIINKYTIVNNLLICKRLQLFAKIISKIHLKQDLMVRLQRYNKKLVDGVRFIRQKST